MSDNVSVTPGTGNIVAADEVVDGTLGTVKVQYVKLMDGTLDGTTKAGVGANGLKTDGSGVTQPISAASLPLPSGAATEATLLTRTKPSDVQLVDGSAHTQPISGSVSVTNFPADQTISVDRSGRTVVMKTGTLVTTAVTADQVILTYTVTVGKTFWLEYISSDVRLTVLSSTASILGTISLENPTGTKLFTSTETNPTTSQTGMRSVSFSEPLPILSGTVIRFVCTPAATTSMTWVANFGGYED